jgi:hypothetical protein
MEENTNEGQSLFASFDFTVEDVDKALEEQAEAKNKSKQICICGHAAGFHDFYNGSDFCTANKQNCKCIKKRLVVEAQDTRLFLRKTTGPGQFHALSQGIRAAEAAGQILKWIVPVECEACKSEVELSPVPVSDRGVILYEDKGLHALLCKECRSTR